MRAEQKTQIHQLTHEAVITQPKALIKTVTGQIKQLNELIKGVMGHKDAQAKATRLQQMDGIAQVADSTLMAELPELGSLTDACISSMAGLAPHPHDSGPMRCQRHTCGGRKKVRCVLYIASLRCVRVNTIIL